MFAGSPAGAVTSHSSPAGAVMSAGSPAGAVVWAYAGCPDINECSLGLARCHPEAQCSNLPGSYNCTCSRGFQGDGFTHCNKEGAG